jgi:hypothetical protein
VGGEIQLGSLGTAATDGPILPASGDYDDGEFGAIKIGRGNGIPIQTILTLKLIITSKIPTCVMTRYRNK